MPVRDKIYLGERAPDTPTLYAGEVEDKTQLNLIGVAQGDDEKGSITLKEACPTGPNCGNENERAGIKTIQTDSTKVEGR